MVFSKANVNTNSTGHISKIHSSESSEEDLQSKIVVEYTATPIVTDIVKINSNNMSITYNQSGKLQVSTKTDGKYSILFYAGNGRLVGQLGSKYLSAGSHSIACDNVNLPKGIVFITLKNGNHSVNSKAVIY